MRNVMFVGAHPDDIEVGCAGTLLKHKAAGDGVYPVVTTWGGYGDRSEETIRQEMNAAEKVLGARYTVLNNKVGHYTVEWKTVGELDKLITTLNIDTVYCVWHGDSHQDHQATYRNIIAACRVKRVKNLYLYELANYSQRSAETFEPVEYVDISGYLDKKIQAIKCYRSYLMFNDEFIDAVVGLALFRGNACGCEHAEAFEVVFETW
jgi:LmbE family N-acetylglucosaminyl deacetylase